MTAIDTTPETIKAIYAHYKSQPQDHRPHLGASRIGGPCDRALWYEFRWCGKPDFPGRILRLFETGNREEARVIKNLRDIGIEVYDQKDGQQIRFSDPECPHFSGSLDGIGRGFPEAPKTWHVIEVKTASKSRFEHLQTVGVKRAHPEYYAQCQIYMHWSKLTRAYFICVCKDNDSIYGERINYDKAAAEALVERAHRIIAADTPPDRKSNNPKYRPCLWCDFKSLCYGETCAEVNCRTCAHANVEYRDIGCVGKYAPIEGGCQNHIFIPDLVPLECTGAGPDAGTITYAGGDGTEIINGPGHTSSEEIREMLS